MGFRNIFLWVVIGVLFTGCSTSLRSSWKNFNAYYNTFYNAQKSYESGLNKNVSQPRDYNPLVPIRIHQPPVNAGYQDFESAIQKSAGILRNHQESKWVDDALFLIGRSYYYQQEYYSADQKFDELSLTTNNPELSKRSVLWKARNFLEMGLNSEAIAFISEVLNSEEDGWNHEELAELRTILGQHFVAQENWSSAEEALRESVPYLESESQKSRGYFLLGQVYERLGILETAYGVYDRVGDHFTDYRLQYLAQRKKAELARQMGRNDIAASIFNAMRRDDKNVDYLSELDFELARTEHERGNYERAELLYNRVLHGGVTPPNPEIRARSYNGLAEIYRHGYDDFMIAAVYYDSAASVNVSRELLPEAYNAQELADSFGSYASLKNELSRQDSLLALGLLKDEELDSVITEMRRNKILELQQQQRAGNRDDRLVTLDQPSGTADPGTTERNGFLNTNNPELQASVKQQFNQVWGNRALVDNWRVQSLMRSQIVQEQFTEQTEDREQTILLDVEIDLSDVPFTEMEQDSVRRNISALQYELGNLMYLSMDMPDSAAYYFQKALENPSDDRINMISLYSLTELYENAGDTRRSMEYADRLLQEYPNSSFAKELIGEGPETEDSSDTQNLIAQYNSVSQNDSLSFSEKADSLRFLSMSFSDHPRSDLILYESIQLYLEEGSSDSLYNEKIIAWDRYKDIKRNGMDSLSIADSLNPLLSDTLILRSDRALVADSTLNQNDLLAIFPYQNTSFDSARSLIDTFLNTYPNSDLANRVELLQEELSLPEASQDEADQEVEDTELMANETDIDDDGYVNCKEIERELRFRSGQESIQELIRSSGEVGSLTIKFRVNHRGLVDTYELITESLSDAHIEDLDAIIESEVVFEPTIYQARSVPVFCTVVISADQ